MGYLRGARVFGKDEPRTDPRSELRVGLSDAPGLRVDGDRAVIGLCHKQVRASAGCLSASAYVSERSDVEIQEWADALGLGADAQAPFAGIDIVVEDASPDTVLALIALAGKLSQQPVPQDWIAYVDRWESGDVWSTGEPSTSWGALHSALVHPYFDREGGGGAFAEALDAGLRYTAALLEAGVDPAQLPRELSSPEHGAARARLSAEYSIYTRLLETSPTLHLSIPVHGSDRRRAVRAVLLSEGAPTGAVKTWLRRDGGAGSPEGFGLIGVYRPNQASGAITFSLDPALGLTLEELWINLEAAENEAWARAGAARPDDDPRPLASFDAGLGAPSNEPWWDDGGRYSLVASPRALADGSPGGRVTWLEALDVLWRTYAPELQVVDGGEAAFSLLKDASRAWAGGRVLPGPNKLRLISVARDDVNDPGLLAWTDTSARACAAVLDAGAVSVAALPRARNFDVIDGRGGFVVVTNAGVLLLEVSSGAGFPAEALISAVEQEAEVIATSEALRTQLRSRAEEAVKAARSSGFGKALKKIVQVMNILEVARRNRPLGSDVEPDPFVREVRRALESRWAAAHRFASVVEEAENVRERVATLSSLRQSRLVSAISVLGFPVVALAGLFGFVFDPIVDGSLAGSPSIGGLWDAVLAIPARIYWPGLALLGGLAFAWVLSIQFFSRLGRGGESATLEALRENGGAGGEQ